MRLIKNGTTKRAARALKRMYMALPRCSPRERAALARGRPPQTSFRVISRDTETQTTRVALEPVTGRSHQLRVHMMSLQHPILGDDLYGGPAEKMADRLLLHAMDLGFKHPETGERMDFHSEPPF